MIKNSGDENEECSRKRKDNRLWIHFRKYTSSFFENVKKGHFYHPFYNEIKIQVIKDLHYLFDKYVLHTCDGPWILPAIRNNKMDKTTALMEFI